MRSVNVVDLISDHDHDGPAIVCGEGRRTYDELRWRIACGQAAFEELSPPGGVAAIIGDTSIEFVETVLAALAAGLAVLPIHPRYPEAELTRAIDAASPALLVSTDAEPVAVLSRLAGTAVRASDLFAHGGKVAAESRTDGPAGGSRRGERHRGVDRDPDHPALLLLTSGTAANARVAVLTHRNVCSSVEQTIGSAPVLTERHHTVLGVMPLTHVLGLVSVVTVGLAIGATVVLLPDTDVETTAGAIVEHEGSVLVAPPVFWYRLASSDVDRAALGSVVLAISGAAPLAGSIASAVSDRFGLALRQGYGLTEASPGLTSSVGIDAPATSVGRPMPGVEIRLVDESGVDARVGDVGEVIARGPNVFAGYLGDDDATAEVLDGDGWLHTGDLAVRDEQGNLFIVGRRSDQIIVSGFNVHPGEVEDLLAQHDTVEAAAVVGEPDREYGELVVAYVVAARGKYPDPDILEAFCRRQLAPFKVPSRFEFVEQLPRNAIGKLHRRMLR